MFVGLLALQGQQRGVKVARLSPLPAAAATAPLRLSAPLTAAAQVRTLHVDDNPHPVLDAFRNLMAEPQAAWQLAVQVWDLDAGSADDLLGMARVPVCCQQQRL